MSRFKTSSSERANFPVILAGGAIVAVIIFLVLIYPKGEGSGEQLQQMRDRMEQMEKRIAFLEERLEDRRRQLEAMSDTLGVFSDNFEEFQALPADMETVKQKTEFLETRQANLEKRMAGEGGAEGTRTAAAPSARTRTEVKTPRIEKTRTAGKPSETAAKPPAPDAKTHTVQDGETLYSIAQRHNVSVDRILELNNLEKTAIIRPGQKLTIRK